MPFKTGVGTADTRSTPMTKILAMFQCPLRRAWVLRFTKGVAVKNLILFQCPLRRAWVLRKSGQCWVLCWL